MNAAAMIQLEQQGLSAVGTHQIATGQTVTDPQDRGLVAEMLAEYAEVKYYTITLRNARVVDASPYMPNRRAQLA